MATPITLSAARKAGILDNVYLAQSAIAEGQVVVHKAAGADQDVILPAAASAMGIAGVSMAGGQSGATTTAGTDMIAVQWHGRAKCKLAAGLTATRGQYAQVNDTSGNVLARTQWSFSAQSLGTFAQTKTAGSNADFIEVDLCPTPIELVRPVTGGCTGTIGAATKYLTAPGQGVAAAAIALYVARFSGEVARNLQASLGTAPGGADTVIYTVYKNPLVSGSYTGWAATTITCTISAAGVSASDLTHTVSLNQGDMLAVQVVSSNVTAAAPTCTFDVT